MMYIDDKITKNSLTFNANIADDFSSESKSSIFFYYCNAPEIPTVLNKLVIKVNKYWILSNSN